MGLILKLGFQNLFRHRRRSVLTITAIMVAVGVLTYTQCHLDGILNTMLEEYIRFQSGHVKIVHPTYQAKERLLPLNRNIPNVSEHLQKLRALPEIKIAAARLRFGGMIFGGDNNEGGVGIGIDPQMEKDFLKLEPDIKEGGPLKQGGIILGRILADKLGLRVGDEATILSQTKFHSIAAGNFRVDGILATGFDFIDKATYYINLDEAQQMLDMEDQATELALKGGSLEQTAAIVKAITPLAQANELAVLSWQQQGNLGQMLNSTRVSLVLILGIILMLAGLTIANTMLMSVMERTKEIGTLLAMGMRPFKIVLLFLCEGFYLGFFGSLGGITIGTTITLILQSTGIHVGDALEHLPMPLGQVLYPHFYPGAPLLALTFGILAAILASILPAYKAAKMLPREAML